MKKLSKKLYSTAETLEAYACGCGCTCNCSTTSPFGYMLYTTRDNTLSSNQV